MMEHSPGTWEEKITDDGQVWVLMPDGHRVSIGDMEETCGICHANARLIAAAPELLKALEKIVNYADPDDYDRVGWIVAMEDMKAIAAAAIARAAPPDPPHP